MCNLYRMNKPQAEVARMFGAIEAGQGGNAPEFVYPGYPGLVVAGGRVGQMHWGFPLVLKGAKGQPLKPRPVNNARSDHLASPFWRASFSQRRCLIPVSAYAEAQGPKGGKTRTWFHLPGQEIFACAGIWRESEEWGACFAMIVTDANTQVAPVHDRMPVILAERDWTAWLDGDVAGAAALCQPWAGTITIDPTDQPWSGRH